MSPKTETSLIHFWLMNPGVTPEETMTHLKFLTEERLNLFDVKIAYDQFNRKSKSTSEKPMNPIGSNPFMEDYDCNDPEAYI